MKLAALVRMGELLPIISLDLEESLEALNQENLKGFMATLDLVGFKAWTSTSRSNHDQVADMGVVLNSYQETLTPIEGEEDLSEDLPTPQDSPSHFKTAEKVKSKGKEAKSVAA